MIYRRNINMILFKDIDLLILSSLLTFFSNLDK